MAAADILLYVSSRERFEALYVGHAGAVKAYAVRRGAGSRADDVVAEVFLTAWRRLQDVPVQPRAWLLGVARRVMANDRRGLVRGEALRARLEHERTPREHTTLEPTDERVLGALQRLKDDDREALTLVAWDGLSHRDASRVLGIRETTFTVRLHRARRRFIRALGDGDPGHHPSTARLETQ